MKTKSLRKIVIVLATLFIGALLLEACAASQPGFSGSKAKKAKVHSSGKMYR